MSTSNEGRTMRMTTEMVQLGLLAVAMNATACATFSSSGHGTNAAGYGDTRGADHGHEVERHQRSDGDTAMGSGGIYLAAARDQPAPTEEGNHSGDVEAVGPTPEAPSDDVVEPLPSPWAEPEDGETSFNVPMPMDTKLSLMPRATHPVILPDFRNVIRALPRLDAAGVLYVDPTWETWSRDRAQATPDFPATRVPTLIRIPF